jgi:hypothetical protein
LAINASLILEKLRTSTLQKRHINTLKLSLELPVLSGGLDKMRDIVSCHRRIIGLPIFWNPKYW